MSSALAPTTGTGATTAHPPALADPELEAAFTRDGIAGPFPVLDAAQIQHPQARLQPLIPDDTAFFAMHRDEDSPELRRQIAEVLMDELGDVISAFLTGHRLLAGCGTFVKQPHEESHLCLHQDWTFVDESRFRTGSFWIPLVDTDEVNGQFHAVLGSHDIGPTLRGSPLWPYPTEFVEDELVEHYLTAFDVPAGSALVYDHRLVHGSFANRSDAPRMAVVLGFVTEGADLHHYYLHSDGQQTRLTVTDDFFLDLVLGPYPTCAGILGAEAVDLPIIQLQPEDLARFRPTSPLAPAPEPAAAPESAPAGPALGAATPVAAPVPAAAAVVADGVGERRSSWFRRLRRPAR